MAALEFVLPPLIEAGFDFLGGIGESKIAEDHFAREEALRKQGLDIQERQLILQQEFGAFDRAAEQRRFEFGAERANVERDNVSNAMINTLSDLMMITGQAPGAQLPQRIRPQVPTTESVQQTATDIFRPPQRSRSDQQGRGFAP